MSYESLAPRGQVSADKKHVPKDSGQPNSNRCVKVQVARVQLSSLLTINTCGCWVMHSSCVELAGSGRQGARPETGRFWLVCRVVCDRVNAPTVGLGQVGRVACDTRTAPVSQA